MPSGCGGSTGLSSDERKQAASEFAPAQSSITIHLADESDLPPALEAVARRALLEQDTDAIVALARKWSERGMADREVQQRLNDAVTALASECSSCVETLDRERETYR